jgi:hypothetical protein
LKACPIKDDGDAKITSFTVLPSQGRQGTTFKIQLKYTSTNGTGTGEIFIGIKTVDRIPLEDAFLMLPQQPGTYTENINVEGTVRLFNL